MINEELNTLYTTKIEDLKAISTKLSNLDGPLLMKCWEEEYLKSDFKILFIGKESKTWLGHLSNNINEALDTYEKFQFAKEKRRKPIFWQYAYKINQLLNPKRCKGTNFLWTNVSKFSTRDGKGLDMDMHKTTATNFNCLVDEIKITKPDVIIFFSGPYYDEKIKVQLEGEVNITRVFDNTHEKNLARIENKDLPFHTYRTYHPGNLEREGKSTYIERLTDYIKTYKTPETEVQAAE